MKDKLIYVVNSNYQLFSSMEDVLMIEKSNFMYPEKINQSNIIVSKINQWNYDDLEKLHNYFLSQNILEVNIEYDHWTNDLMHFFKFKALKFNTNVNTDFEFLYSQLTSNILSVISILESKSHAFTNDFMVYLISIIPSEISLSILKIYFYEKNSFRTTLIWLIDKINII